jgi:hypothetical protein
MVYDEIHGRTTAYTDFDETQLDGSRQYFDLAAPQLRTLSFDVLTCLVGLEIPSTLQDSLSDRLEEILSILPKSTRVYRVDSRLMHWEAHIIRRPGEPVPPFALDEVAEIFDGAVSGSQPFGITYRGFFVSSDGTIAFQGYGETAHLRSRLGAAMPFSSPRQNETGHISGARILDPVGPDAFRRLLELRRSTQNDVLGVLPVHKVKLVLERRWYLEDYTIIKATDLAS